MQFKRGLRSKARRLSPTALRAALDARGDDVLLVDWVNRGPVRDNWGDAIAPVLAERLSGKRVINRRDVLNLSGKPVYTSIGSMLGTIDSPHAVVWGTGFVDSGSTLQVRPVQVCAVRGPRSRQKLLELGVDCPEIFGDPALLAPMFWKPAPTRKYRLGIIPHFRDFPHESAQRFAGFDDVRVIDIKGTIEQVIQEITECEVIASGSLHGLVCADAYGIPATWVQFSDAAYGDGFKFRDYLDSTGTHRVTEPMELNAATPIEAIQERIVPHHLGVDIDQFLAACPFLDRSVLPSGPA
jgi:pyruvyltransferase